MYENVWILRRIILHKKKHFNHTVWSILAAKGERERTKEDEMQ